ncbi:MULTISPECIES: hypothetical protein [Luteimonas]|uniref:hypothetical protein n=1 Tax=Luteimonas TaxID=83614 RepID=UPI00117DEE61|nr:MULTISPECIES: hypothetical protein [Luteimonas]
MRGITTAAGYRTELGAGNVVLDDEDVDGDDSDEACIFIDATDIDPAAGGKRFDSPTMEITIEFVVPRRTGVNAKLLAHRGCADLVRALNFKTTGRDTNLPQGFATFELTGARLRGYTDEEASASFVIAQVTARAGLTELHSPA